MRIGWFYFAPFRMWKFYYKQKDYGCLFHNLKSVRPGRWGFRILGLEFGNRNPGNWFGVLLIKLGLWKV